MVSNYTKLSHHLLKNPEDGLKATGAVISVLKENDAVVVDIQDERIIFSWADTPDLTDDTALTDLNDKDIEKILSLVTRPDEPESLSGKMMFSIPKGLDLPNLHDSMQLDSGITVASLSVGNVEIDIRVCGDVRVYYKGERYAHAHAMPSELLEKFKNGTADNDPDISIEMNNWFESFIYIDGQHAGGDVVDVDGETPVSLFSSMYDMYLEITESDEPSEIRHEVVITDWSEMDLLHDLLSDFLVKNGKKHRAYEAARNLLAHIRPALQEKTNQI